VILPAKHYGDPLQVLIAKENAIESRIKGCKGCGHLVFDASGRKVGRKGKCSLWRESE
jgi:hypothetical protein